MSSKIQPAVVSSYFGTVYTTNCVKIWTVYTAVKINRQKDGKEVMVIITLNSPLLPYENFVEAVEQQNFEKDRLKMQFGGINVNGELEVVLQNLRVKT